MILSKTLQRLVEAQERSAIFLDPAAKQVQIPNAERLSRNLTQEASSHHSACVILLQVLPLPCSPLCLAARQRYQLCKSDKERTNLQNKSLIYKLTPKSLPCQAGRSSRHPAICLQARF